MTDQLQPGVAQGIPQSPAPLAVPWTPPAQSAQPIAPQPVVQTPQLQTQVQMPAQPQASQAPMPQTQNPSHYPQAYRAAPHPAPAQSAASVAHNHAPVQNHPTYAQQPPMNAAPMQAHGYAPQAQTMTQQHMAPQTAPAQPAYGHPTQPHLQQPAVQNAPPMPAEATQAPVEGAPESKSLFAKLFKRSPKTPSEPVAPKNRGSIFDKNFVFGLVAGTVLGFLVLPILFSNAPEQAMPAYAPTAEMASDVDIATLAQNPAAIQDGEAFLDTVLNSEAP